MAKTRTDLDNAAVSRLIGIGPGQSPEAEDTAKADEIYDAFAAYVSAAGHFTIVDEDDIDLAAFEPLADYFAWFAAPHFLRPRDVGLLQSAILMLAKLRATTPTKEPLAVDYF